MFHIIHMMSTQYTVCVTLRLMKKMCFKDNEKRRGCTRRHNKNISLFSVFDVIRVNHIKYYLYCGTIGSWFFFLVAHRPHTAAHSSSEPACFLS